MGAAFIVVREVFKTVKSGQSQHQKNEWEQP